MSEQNNIDTSFVFYRSFYETISLIPDAAMRCRAYTAICAYAFEGIVPEEDEDIMVKIVFTQAKAQMDANNKRRADGCKGGRPKKSA